MHTELPLFESSLPAVADWLGNNPRVPASFNDTVFVDMVEGMMNVLTPYGGSPEPRVALIKMLAAVVGAAVLHGTDEDVFALSQDIRADLYSEIMRLRRAVLRDQGTGALDA